MWLLAKRLRASGIEPRLFGYCAAFESWDGCRARLRRFIEARMRDGNFLVIGHSLGCVLLRAVIAELEIKPTACFFMAPPSCACKAARRLSRSPPYRLLTGEMGQLLADAEFMRSLPTPEVPTLIYAGSGGPKGRWSPFGEELNDGILAVSETLIGDVPVQIVPAIHTLIMNSTSVTRHIVASAISPTRPTPM
jgi:hypothetical protein